MITVLWQVTDAGVQEVIARPVNLSRTRWLVTPITNPVDVALANVGDLVDTDELALLLWHERRGELAQVATIEGQIRDRSSRDRWPA